MIGVFIALGLIIALVLCFWYLLIHSDWDVHKQMVEENTVKHGYAGYNEFVREFNKVEWRATGSYNGLVGDTGDKYFASIISFGGKGMIVKNPIEYIKVKKYVEKYYNENFGGNSVNWYKEEI